MKAYKILGMERDLYILVFDRDNVYVCDTPEESISRLPRANRFSLKERVILLRIIEGNGYPVKTGELVEAYGSFCGDKALDDPLIYESTEDKIREGIREIRRRVGEAYPFAKSGAGTSFLKNYSGSGYSIDLSEVRTDGQGGEENSVPIAEVSEAEQGTEAGRPVRVTVSLLEQGTDPSDLYSVITDDRHAFCWTEISEAVYLNYVSARSDIADGYEEKGWKVLRPKAKELDPAKIMIELIRDDRDTLIQLFSDRLGKEDIRRFVVHCRNISHLRRGRIRLVLFHRSAESFLFRNSEYPVYHYYDRI